MVERRSSLSFLLEAMHSVVKSRHISGQNLQRDFTIELCILRQIHLAHPTRANLCADFVAAEFCANGDRHKRAKRLSDENEHWSKLTSNPRRRTARKEEPTRGL